MKMWVCICKNRKESGDKLYYLSGCCLKSWDHFVKSVEYWKCVHIYEYVLHSKEHFKVKSIYSKHNYIEPRGQPSFFSKKVSSEHFRSLIHPQQSLALVILFAHLEFCTMLIIFFKFFSNFQLLCVHTNVCICTCLVYVSDEKDNIL